MRVVLDTNTIISGLLWHGAPRQILEKARDGALELFTTIPLLAELEEVLLREKFSRHLAALDLSPSDLVAGYAALAAVVRPAQIAPVIVKDPDDDAVLACALAAQAEVIVSGDSHLLELGDFQEMLVLPAEEFLERLG